MGGKDKMSIGTKLGGQFDLPGTSISVYRMGYGAMQLAGPGVWGPPRDMDAAMDVLRAAITAGVNHIDTSDFYGPHVTNQIIKKAIHPYPTDLVIVTKLGCRRGVDKSWNHALSRKELLDGVHDNLLNLGLDQLDVVNLRVGGITEPSEGSIEEPLSLLAFSQHSADPRHIFAKPSWRKSRCCGPGTSIGCYSRAQRDRRERPSRSPASTLMIDGGGLHVRSCHP
jgi:pyridoxine 4-dehydrogenase